MLKLRRRSSPRTEVVREGCNALLETVLEGANSNVFSKQKAALISLDRLYEEQCVSALIRIMNQFSGSDDSFQQHLAKKAREYLKRGQP